MEGNKYVRNNKVAVDCKWSLNTLIDMDTLVIWVKHILKYWIKAHIYMHSDLLGCDMLHQIPITHDFMHDSWKYIKMINMYRL